MQIDITVSKFLLADIKGHFNNSDRWLHVSPNDTQIRLYWVLIGQFVGKVTCLYMDRSVFSRLWRKWEILNWLWWALCFWRTPKKCSFLFKGQKFGQNHLIGKCRWYTQLDLIFIIPVINEWNRTSSFQK